MLLAPKPGAVIGISKTGPGFIHNNVDYMLPS